MSKADIETELLDNLCVAYASCHWSKQKSGVNFLEVYE